MNKLPKSILTFDQFLNEPLQYGDQQMVHDYQHAVYKEWKKVVKDVEIMRETLKLAEETLKNLLDDSQHKNHNCGEMNDYYCPVLQARKALSVIKECNNII